MRDGERVDRHALAPLPPEPVRRSPPGIPWHALPDDPHATHPLAALETGKLSAAAKRRAMRLSQFDGLAYALMLGLSETYFIADAIRMGASSLQLSLVVCLPLSLGALGPMLALRLLGRLSTRRPLVVAGALGQASTLLLLGASAAFGFGSPELLIGLSCLYQASGQCSGTAWSSWYGDLVPARMRGRYFSRRNRLVHFGSFLGVVLGGLLLAALESEGATGSDPSEGLGFATLFVVSAVFRLTSAGLLAASPEPRFQRIAPRSRVLSFLGTPRGRSARLLILAVMGLQLGVYIASPYFGPRMLSQLEFSYTSYMLATGAIVVAKVLLLPAWGRIIDAHGARTTLTLAASLLALVPLPWIFLESVPAALFVQAFSGAAWGGFELSLFVLMLDIGTRSTRPHLFAAHSFTTGQAQLMGGLVGAQLLGAVGDLRFLFAASLVARTLAALLMQRFLPHPEGHSGARPRDLLLRLVGFRPSGGMVHRPLYPTEELPRRGDGQG